MPNVYRSQSPAYIYALFRRRCNGLLLEIRVAGSFGLALVGIVGVLLAADTALAWWEHWLTDEWKLEEIEARGAREGSESGEGEYGGRRWRRRIRGPFAVE